MAKKRAAKKPVTKRTPAKKPVTKKAAKKPVTKRTPKASNSPALSPEAALKVAKSRGGQKSGTVTTKKAPKKVPEPKVRIGSGFLPGNRKALREQRKAEMKKVAFDALTPAQQAKRLRDRKRKSERSANAKKSAGKAGNSANTGTRPTAKSGSKSSKAKAETGVAKVRKATTTKSASAKGKQKAVPARSRR